MPRIRKKIETRWDEIIKSEKDLETNYNVERVAIERKLAEQFTGQSDFVLKQASERLASFKRLFDKLADIKYAVSQAQYAVQDDEHESQLIDKSIQIRQQVQLDIKKLQHDAINIQAELKHMREENNMLRNQRRLLEEQLHHLSMEDRQSHQIQIQEYEQREQRRYQLESLLQETVMNDKQRSNELDRSLVPLKHLVEQRKSEFQRISAKFKKAKKHVEDLKRKLEQTEASFMAQIAQIRGQRQHLRHRLDLKIKAIENIKSGSNLLKSSDLVHMAKPQLQTQQNKTDTSNSDAQDNTYFKMHVNKKKSGGSTAEQHGLHQADTAFTGYDQELYDALLSNSQNSQQSIDTQLQKLSDKHLAMKRRDIVTMEDLEEVLGENDHLLAALTKQNSKPPVEKSLNHQRVELQPSVTGTVKLFGPQTRPLTRDEADNVVSKIRFMCQGTLLHKRKENVKPPNPNLGPLEQQQQQMIKNNYMVRHVSLSNEFTRLQIRDKKKKVPESFIKVEHMLKVQPLDTIGGGGVTCYGFALILSSKKVEFVTFDDNDCRNWIEGLNLLIEHKSHLFSLKYNYLHQAW
jgi:hypothetical protein